MEGLAGDLTYTFLVAPFETSSQDLVVVVVVVVVATCPVLSYKQKFGGSSRDLQSRESLPVNQAVNALNLKCTMLDVTVVNCSG